MLETDKFVKIESILNKIVNDAKKDTLVIRINSEVVIGDPKYQMYSVMSISTGGTKFIATDKNIDEILVEMWDTLRIKAKTALHQATDEQLDQAYQESLIIG